MYKYICLALVFGILGCATVKHSQLYSDAGFKLTDINGQNVSLIGTNQMVLNEFKKSFEDEYSSSEVLYKEALDTLSLALAAEFGGDKIKVIEDPDANLIFNNSGYSEEAISKAQTFFNSQTHEYIICLKKITIDEEVTTHHAAAPVNTSSNSSATVINNAPTKSTSALVKTEVEIWKTSEKKKVYAFELSDEAGVTLMMFKTALKNAVNKTMTNIAKYIKTGGNLK